MSVSPQSTEKLDHVTTRGHNQKKKRGGILKRVASGLTSLAGIATAIATITTSAAAVLGVTVHAKDTQLQQARAQASTQAKQIRDQTQQIQQLQKAATAPSAVPSQPGSSGNAQVSGVIHYLSNETPTVQNSYLQAGQQVIAAKPYVNTVIFSCDAGASGSPDLAYDVAGSSTFTTEVGIPDNMQNATGVIATVIFSNESGQQVGQQVQVSLGHPVSVKLDVSGITQLGMTCAGRDRQTNQAATNFQVALGNAGVS